MLPILLRISSVLISTLPVHSPAFFPKPLPIFPVLAVTNTRSCVGPQNKIGHPAHRNRQLMAVPVLSAAEYKSAPKHVIVFVGLCSEICEYKLSCGLRKRDVI